MRGDSFYSDYVEIRQHAIALSQQVNRKFGTEVLTPARALKMILGNVFPQLNELSSPEIFILYDRSSGEYILDPLTEKPRTGAVERDKLDRAYVSELLGRALRTGEAAVLEFARKKS